MQALQWRAESALPGGDRVKVSENLGATEVAPVAPVDTSLTSTVDSLHFTVPELIVKLIQFLRKLVIGGKIFCKQCSLQFGNKVVFSMHLQLVHGENVEIKDKEKGLKIVFRESQKNVEIPKEVEGSMKG